MCIKRLPITFIFLIFSNIVLAEGEWQTLFDGTSTNALRGYRQASFPTKAWKVVNNELKTKSGFFSKRIDLITRKTYKDFILELEWKVTPGGNSGVMYRVIETPNHSWKSGPEMQILDDDLHIDGKNPKRTAGALYDLITPAKNKVLNPVGDFNKARLVVKDNKVEHWLNGVKIVEYTWRSPDIIKKIAKSKFKTFPYFMKQDRGHIVFQHHGEEFWLRNIRIKEL